MQANFLCLKIRLYANTKSKINNAQKKFLVFFKVQGNQSQKKEFPVDHVTHTMFHLFSFSEKTKLPTPKKKFVRAPLTKRNASLLLLCKNQNENEDIAFCFTEVEI